MMPARRQLTDADHIWNRACSDEDADLREGDKALAALLLMDGYIQNGGVCHTFDLRPREFAEGISGYQFFGLHDLVAIIRSYRADEDDDELNKRYYAKDNSIRAKFDEMYRAHPERFAPLVL